MEKKSKDLSDLRSIKVLEIHRISFVPGDKVDFYIDVREPIEVVINKLVFKYE